MNTLFCIFEEFINIVFSKNVADFLSIDDLIFRDFIFLSFSKNSFQILKNKTSKYFINILLYLDFLKYHKKPLCKDFYLIQNCSLLTFFTKTVSFFVKLDHKNQFSFNQKLKEPFKKMIQGILLEKKINQLNDIIKFWKNQNQNLLIFDILNQSYQEILRKKLIRTADEKNFLGSYLTESNHLNIFKKRFKCFFPFLFAQEIFRTKNMFLRTKFKINSQLFHKTFLIKLKKIFIEKYFKARLDILKFYFYSEIYCRTGKNLYFLKFFSKQINSNKI
jgi:hypothetical protein